MTSAISTKVLPTYGRTNAGISTKTGKWSFPFSSTRRGISPEGLARVKTGGWSGKFGYIDKTGEVKIEAAFDEADDFREDRAIVVVHDKYGIIDKDGAYVLEPKYEYIASFSDGLAHFREGQSPRLPRHLRQCCDQAEVQIGGVFLRWIGPGETRVRNGDTSTSRASW